METSLAESQTDSYFPTMWPNGYPKQKKDCKNCNQAAKFNWWLPRPLFVKLEQSTSYI